MLQMFVNICLTASSPPVSSDFTADEKMEMENIKLYKKDLLDDIQVNSHNWWPTKLRSVRRTLTLLFTCRS